MDIGDRIKLLRTSAGMTQEELAKHLNVSKQAIYKYESKIVTNIPMDKIAMMSVLFNVPPAKIMGWEEKFISRKAVNNRIEIIQEIKNYSSQQICDFAGIPIDEYKNLIKRDFSSDNTQLIKLSQASGFPLEFINGLPYTIKIPVDKWHNDYQEDYFTANESTQTIIECKVGKPAFHPKSALDNITISENRQKLIDWARSVPEDKVEPVLQALQSILAIMQ